MSKKWIVMVCVVVGVVAVACGANLLLASSLSSGADSRLLQVATDEAMAIIVGENGVSAPAQSAEISDLGVELWVFANGQTLTGPDMAPDVAAAARALDETMPQYVDVSGQQVRLYGLPLYFQDRRVGTIVTGLSTAPYHQAQRAMFIGTGVFAVAILIILVFAGLWLRNGSKSLRPVTRGHKKTATVDSA